MMGDARRNRQMPRRAPKSGARQRPLEGSILSHGTRVDATHNFSLIDRRCHDKSTRAYARWHVKRAMTRTRRIVITPPLGREATALHIMRCGLPMTDLIRAGEAQRYMTPRHAGLECARVTHALMLVGLTRLR